MNPAGGLLLEVGVRPAEETARKWIVLPVGRILKVAVNNRHNLLFTVRRERKRPKGAPGRHKFEFDVELPFNLFRYVAVHSLPPGGECLSGCLRCLPLLPPGSFGPSPVQDFYCLLSLVCVVAVRSPSLMLDELTELTALDIDDSSAASLCDSLDKWRLSEFSVDVWDEIELNYIELAHKEPVEEAAGPVTGVQDLRAAEFAASPELAEEMEVRTFFLSSPSSLVFLPGTQQGR